MNSTVKYSALPLLASLLTACGGGGGSSATLTPFTSWNSVQPNSTITVPGISQSGTFAYDNDPFAITSRTQTSSASGASFTQSLNANGDVTAVSISPAGGTPISFSEAAGDIFGVLAVDETVLVAVSPSGSKGVLAADPIPLGWNYQSFGVWFTDTLAGTGTYGAISVGAATSGASIPTSGSATYTGFTGGTYVSGTGDFFFTTSSMTAAANFVTRNIGYSTSSTQISDDLVNFTSASTLNMSGTLTYSAGVNQITGNVTTNGGLTGTVNAQFYGPSAEEIGGTFSVSSGGLEGYSGAFGGKK
jgi:hypothetical protein